MPCQSNYDDYSNQSATRAELNRLTAENDMLREALIKIFEENPGFSTKLPKKLVAAISTSQIKHRREDLDRLEKTFIKNKNTELLQKVWDADPSKPLEPQLGFNPDDY
jgi:hypothetical protein